MSLRDHFANAKKNGLTQKAIADQLGVSEPTVSRWASEEQPIPPKWQRMVAMLLQCPLDDVVPR